MKFLKYGLYVAATLLLNSVFTSCSDDDNIDDFPEVVDFQALSMDMENDYWTKCYDMTVGAVRVDGFAFSHSAMSFDYDGTIYSEWSGFCPSKVNDISDHENDWVSNQWACISENPYEGIYLVGNSGSQVSEDPLSNTTCSVEMINHGFFKPSFVYVNNSSYAYYCAKNGSDFNEPFTAQDNLMLYIIGQRSGAMTAQLKVPLIQNGLFLTQWIAVSLEQLGIVDKVLFYVDSTSKGPYGLNVPSYFCITNFGYNFVETTTGK